MKKDVAFTEFAQRDSESGERKAAPLVLVVDDLIENIDLLKTFLKPRGFEVVTARSGEAALELIAARPPDVVLLDVVMPGIGGIETCRRIKENEATARIPVVMITGVSEHDVNVRSLQAGADDFLTKPLDSSLLEARLRNCLRSKMLQDRVLRYQAQLEEYNERLEMRIRERTAQLERTQQVTVFALARLSEARDTETGAHLDRMRRYVRILALEMSTWDEYRETLDSLFVEQLYFSSPLHDIGKVGIPDEILLKPGKLTDEEFEIMKWHTIIGGDTLTDADVQAGTHSFLEMSRDIAYAHHEKWNGSGYPNGLSGKAIPLAARIVALGDVYDALTSKRPYKPAFPHEKAHTIIMEGNGTHFDPDVVKAYLKREKDFIAIKEELQDTDDGASRLHKVIQQLETMRSAKVES